MFYTSDSQIHKYYYDIERHFLRKKAFHVGVILSVFMVLIMAMLVSVQVDISFILLYTMVFLTLIGLNMVLYYKVDIFPDIHFLMYATTFGLYLIAIGLILEIRHPSIFTLLFLFYGILALYQHTKTSLLNNLFLFFSGSIVVLGFPGVFSTNGVVSLTAYIYGFMLIFISILSISSFILAKQKEKFYWNVSIIRERELRITAIVFDLEKDLTNRTFDFNAYYDKLEAYSEALSKEIGVEKSIFSKRINTLKKLSDNHLNTTSEDGFNNQTDETYEELKQLKLNEDSKFPYVAFKIAQYATMDFDEGVRTTNLDSVNKTFDEHNDTLAVKVVAFSAFITLLRTDKPYFDALSIDSIETLFDNNEFAKLFDENLLNLFKENKNTFERLTDTALFGGDADDLHNK